MSSPALSLEATTIHIAEEIKVRASIDATFAALLEQLGPYNETQVDKPMPMKLEDVYKRQVENRCFTRQLWRITGSDGFAQSLHRPVLILELSLSLIHI